MLGEAEHDGSGRKLRAQYYLWLDSLPLATIDADYDAQGKVGNPTLLYLHGDHLDTPRLATDASGQIAWQWQSDAFGRGEALSQGSTQVNLRFPGSTTMRRAGCTTTTSATMIRRLGGMWRVIL